MLLQTEESELKVESGGTTSESIYKSDVAEATQRPQALTEMGPIEVEADEEENIGTTARPRRRKWLYLSGLVVVGLLAAFLLRPANEQIVTVAQPVAKTITESIASSGAVGSATETNVGAQSSGIVAQVFVKEGDHVQAGQLLAVLKNDVAEAQLSQAKVTADRTRAEYAETTRPALSSDVAAATEQVNQAQAQVAQQRAAVTEAEKTLASNQAQQRQRQAERELAEKTLERAQFLVEKGVYARSQLDSAQESLKVAQAQETAAQHAVEQAQASLRYAQEGIKAAEANVEVKKAQLETTRMRSTPEQIQVARLKALEAEESLRVSKQQAANANVVAPFAGTVTKINTQPGQTMGTNGALSLVSDVTEIRLNVDESNLADLKVGQEAIISSNAFLGQTFKGTISSISPSVNQTRGAVEVKISPNNPPEWLRTGQTVNVNIVTNPSVQRLLAPQTALTRSGERTIVFVLQDGKAVEKQVVTRSPLPEGVPVVSGLDANDRVVVNAQNIKAGDALRVK